MDDLIQAARDEARDNSFHNRISALVDQARNAQAYRAHGVDRDGEPRHMVRQPAATGATINLRDAFVPNLFDKDGNLRRAPGATLAASTVRMDAGIIANSRVAGAGANVVVYADPTKAIPTGRTGDVVLSRVPASFRVIEPATFAIVADGADVTVQALPVTSADIDFATAPNLALKFNMTRGDRRVLSDDEQAAQIAVAVTLGLARAADARLLAALAAASLADFSIASVAAKGLRWNELRALVGTAGNGATVDASGALLAGGVAAELSADMAGTVAGAWDRSAVAIHQDVALHFERLNLNGDLSVTAWANIVPLIPDADFFFEVPAP